MSEPALLQPAPVGDSLPSPCEGAGVPCERCGTFVQGKPEQVGVREVCAACAPLLRQELRLYPTWYVYVLGIGLNFTLAGVLSAINWKRLGDRTRMRNSLIVTALAVACSGLMLAYDNRVFSALTNLIGTGVAAQALGPAYEQHRKAGGARANLFWPPLITGLLFLLFAVVLVLTDMDHLLAE
jgi:hypothetical protein